MDHHQLSPVTELSEVDLSFLLSQISTVSGDDVTDRTIEEIIREAEELTKTPPTPPRISQSENFTNIYKSEIDSIQQLSEKLKQETANEEKQEIQEVSTRLTSASQLTEVKKTMAKAKTVVQNSGRPARTPRPVSAPAKMAPKNLVPRKKNDELIQPKLPNESLLKTLQKDNAQLSLEIKKIKDQLHTCNKQCPLQPEQKKLILSLRDELQLCRAAISKISLLGGAKDVTKVAFNSKSCQTGSGDQEKKRVTRTTSLSDRGDVQLLVTIRGLQAELTQTKREMKRLKNELAKSEGKASAAGRMTWRGGNKRSIGLQTMGLTAPSFFYQPPLEGPNNFREENEELRKKLDALIAERNNQLKELQKKHEEEIAALVRENLALTKKIEELHESKKFLSCKS